MNKKHSYRIVILLLFLAVGIQPAVATIVLSSSGWDPDVGDWESGTLTGTLTQNVDQTIMITSDGITLDGAGYTVTGSGSAPGNGVFLQEKSGVTIKGLNVQNFATGIHVLRSDNCTVTGNTVLNNGIGISISTYSNYNTVTSNIVSGNEDGISIYMHSPNNNLTDNTVSNNTQYGIKVEHCNDYTITGNSVSNGWIAIRLYDCSATEPNVNTITNNTALNNVGGIYLNTASKNQIYNNNFIVGDDTSWQASVSGGSGNVFDLGDPALGGEGGNYWSDYTGQDRGDGIGDTAYTFTDGKDNFPWVVQDGWDSYIPTPEEAIEALIVKVEALNGEYGISNALDAKLQNALDALEAKNAGQRQDAINKMQAFINAVEAQSGNKIPVEIANDLIADANYIISLL